MQNYTSTFIRREKKYLLSAAQQVQLRTTLAAHTLPDVYNDTDIYTIYYDTPDYLLIRRSIEKPVYKEKLRVRTYGVPGEADPAFIEMKRKCGKTVYKRRIALPYHEVQAFLTSPGTGSQIAREIGNMLQHYPGLCPSIAIVCHRISLSGREDPSLRITFDSDIRWKSARTDLMARAKGIPLLEDGQQIMELKCSGALPFWISRLLSDLSCFPVSFSKYGKAYEAMLHSSSKRNPL